jgi:hypothetical protein
VRLHLSGKKLGVVVHACHFSNSRKLKIEGSLSTPAWRKRETLFLKKNHLSNKKTREKTSLK